MSFVYIITTLLIIFGIILFLSNGGMNKEEYGGPIKNIKHIPFNDCARICTTYFDDCMAKYGDIGADWCEKRFKEHCIMECYYSHYHRL